MPDLNKEEIYAMENLSKLVSNAVRSKTILKTLTKLQDKGMITFDPMAGEAALTEDGRRALR